MISMKTSMGYNMSSKWEGYGHTVEFKESGNGSEYIVKVDGQIVLFSGGTHAHPEQAAKAFFFSTMEDFRNKVVDIESAL